MPPIDADAEQRAALVRGETQTRMSPGATSSVIALAAKSPTEQIGCAVGARESRNGARPPGRSASDRAAAAQGSPRGRRERAIGGDPQRQRVARDQAFDRCERRQPCVLGARRRSARSGSSRFCIARPRRAPARAAAARRSERAADLAAVGQRSNREGRRVHQRRDRRAIASSRACRADRGNRRERLRAACRRRPCAARGRRRRPCRSLRVLAVGERWSRTGPRLPLALLRATQPLVPLARTHMRRSILNSLRGAQPTTASK